MPKRATYTDEQRTAALELYRDHGPAEAQRQSGIPSGTIRAWASKGPVATERREKQAAAVEAAALTTKERRIKLGEQLLGLAEATTEEIRSKISGASLRDLVGAMDYTIKNSQLLSGEATTRTEHAGREAAHVVADELASRRAKAA